MNVLEKILEDIDERKLSHKQKLEIEVGGRSVGEIRERISELNWVAEIIRSYIDEYKDTNVISNDGWIPVEERLPEVQEGLADEYCPEFNVTIKGAERATTLKYSWDGTWFDDRGDIYDVIAWQPLPEGYKGGDDRA